MCFQNNIRRNIQTHHKKLAIKNSPNPPPDPLITVPTMKDFDQETLMDHRRQSCAFMHILGLCKIVMYTGNLLTF